MRILVLVHEQLVPPKDSRQKIKNAGKDRKFFDWEVEYDIGETLIALGHTIEFIGIYDDLIMLKDKILEFKPHLIFNLLEEFNGNTMLDQHVVSVLELLGIPYTGANPKALTLARDKALTKKILQFHGIETPKFQIFEYRKKLELESTLKFPLIVKCLHEQGSLFLSQNSVVNSFDELVARVKFIHLKTKSCALVEEFIEGREILVGVLGGKKVTVLAPWEVDFGKLKKLKYRIQSRQLKFDQKFQKRNEIELGVSPLSLEENLEIENICKRVYKVLGFTGHARIDFRFFNGKFYVLEVNANPDISDDGEFSKAAEVKGFSYPQLISKIISDALKIKPKVLRL